ncbi:hypothetical protein BI040_gp08 [Escherichia phage vB_EcoS_NBD2]|uniref:Uncharacterized protein n=1 Tax=Escherichia phage vB_EcoS_NBD2 TaxID=1852563 RepID=A0A192Y9G0_9CAUD|nr:hypothetical protein BI040_gp08 [Escherichia phage vB_EcoS_NBD2]ANM45850.1 hypothetical protein NBD2_08 [Escherichia phage vB_EcoS_NBD2]
MTVTFPSFTPLASGTPWKLLKSWILPSRPARFQPIAMVAHFVLAVSAATITAIVLRAMKARCLTRSRGASARRIIFALISTTANALAQSVARLAT